VAFILSFVCGISALVIVWLLYPKDIAYGTALKDSYLFYNAQQIGTLPTNYPIAWRGNAYLQVGAGSHNHSVKVNFCGFLGPVLTQRATTEGGANIAELHNSAQLVARLDE